MTNNAQLLPLPELSDDDLELLHYNPNTSDVVEFLHRYAQAYALACIEAAKPADHIRDATKMVDALGSLPVVAWKVVAKQGFTRCILERYPDMSSFDLGEDVISLTDHAQATEALAKKEAFWKRVVNVADAQTNQYIEKCKALEAKLAGVDGLVEALRGLRRGHAECDDPWYSCPKSENGCANEHAGDKCTCGADSENAIIDAALATYEAAHGEKK